MNDTAHQKVGGISDCQRTPILAPRIYEGGARRAGGVRIFAQQIFGKAHFSLKSGHPLRPGGSRLRLKPPGHLPHEWGRQEFFDTLRYRPPSHPIL